MLQPVITSMVSRKSRELPSGLHMLSTPGLRYQDCLWNKGFYAALASGIDTSAEYAMREFGLIMASAPYLSAL